MKKSDTRTATIYLAGDLCAIRECCRAHCDTVGLCVSVCASDYIYTNGGESGAAVGLVNYPRFPKSAAEFSEATRQLAEALLNECAERSLLIVERDFSTWLTKDKSR